MKIYAGIVSPVVMFTNVESRGGAWSAGCWSQVQRREMIILSSPS